MFTWLQRFLDRGRRDRAVGAVCLKLGLLNECPVCRELTDAQPNNDDWNRAEQACAEGALPSQETGQCLQVLRQKVEDAPFHCICEEG